LGFSLLEVRLCLKVSIFAAKSHESEDGSVMPNFTKLYDPHRPKNRVNGPTTYYDTAPGVLPPWQCPDSKLWFYGNTNLLKGDLATIDKRREDELYNDYLMRIEVEARCLVLSGKVLVTGVHNEPQQRAAILPLRWGAPRIVVFSGGFYHHLGRALNQEPFRAARWWRYEWDPACDLAISRRSPTSVPTYSLDSPTVDALIKLLVEQFGNSRPATNAQAKLF
jgi:hypothetical protein